MKNSFLMSLPLVGGLVSSVIATCYHFNGSAVDDYYQPCSGSTEFSMCCHTGVANNGGDACGSGDYYGLCGVTGTQLWRESCTDPTWKDSACLQLCTYGVGIDNDVMITRCNDGSYCCGENNATCCSAGDGMLIVNNQAVPATLATTSSASKTATTSSSSSSPSSSSSSSSSSGSSSSSTSAATSEPTSSTSSNQSLSTGSPQAKSSSSLSPGAKAGIGIGIAALVLAVAMAVAFFLWKRQESKKAYGGAPIDIANEVKHQAGLMPPNNFREVDSGWRGYEADSQLHEQYPRPGHPAELS